MPLVFLLFVLVPIAEIALFIQVGDVIGLWPTLGIVIATAFLGTGLLRAQGLAAFARAQATMAEGRVPVEEVVHGFCLVIAGALLLTPGFLTDTIGFALFLPPVRLALGRTALRWLSKHGTVHVHTSSNGQAGFSPSSPTQDTGSPTQDTGHRVPDIVEGEAQEIDRADGSHPDGNEDAPSSPWRQTPPNTKD